MRHRLTDRVRRRVPYSQRRSPRAARRFAAHGAAGLVAVLVLLGPGTVASGLTNAKFESGSLEGWRALGNASFESSYTSIDVFGRAFLGGPIEAVEGECFAVIRNDLDTAAGVSETEAALGVDNGTLAALSSDVLLGVSSIRRSFSVAPGDTLSLQWSFDGDTDLGNPFVGDDFGLLTIEGEAFRLGSVLSGPPIWEGFQPFEYEFTSGGEVTLGLGVVEVLDAAGSQAKSRLLIDDVDLRRIEQTVTPEPTGLAALGLIALLGVRPGRRGG